MRTVRIVVFLAYSLIGGGWILGQCQMTTADPLTSNSVGHTFEVSNGSANHIGLERMDIHMGLGGVGRTVEIWVLPPEERLTPALVLDETRWTRVARFVGVPPSTVPGAVAPLPPLPTPIVIEPGCRRAITVLVYGAFGTELFYGGADGAVGEVFASDGVLQIHRGYGTGEFALPLLSPRRMSATFHYSCPGTPSSTSTQYQTNPSQASLVVENLVATRCQRAKVIHPIYACTPPVAPSGSIAIRSALSGQPWDLAISPAPLQPASLGGATLPDGQIANLDLNFPLVFMLGGLGATWPGLPLGGSSALNIQYTLASPALFSLQSVFVDPSSASGLRLTQASEIHGVATPIPTTADITLSTGRALALNVTTPPYCWVSQIPFAGTSYSTMNLMSRGRVSFGSPIDNIGGVFLSEFLTALPSVAVWTEWHTFFPGGGVRAQYLGGGIIRIDYTTQYLRETAGPISTFGFQFDTNNGEVVIDGLTGIAPNPRGTAGGFFLPTEDSMILGITRGSNIATNNGLTTFTAAGAGNPVNATSIVADFYAATTSGPGLAASLVPGTLNGIRSIPSAAHAPNYSWVGF